MRVRPPGNWRLSSDYPNALQVELDIAVSPTAAPNVGQGAWCRVWGIPLQTVLTANQFTDQQIQVFGGMSAGLPLANPNQQGLLVQGTVLPALGNWTGVNMYIDFYITPGTLGNPTVPGAANIVHNQPAQQPLSTAVKNALQTAFPGFKANVRIPMKPARHSKRKPATDSDLKPAGIPI